MQSKDQGKFSSITNLDPGHRWFYRSCESDYPLYMTVAWPDPVLPTHGHILGY